jgi:ZIP family zinc transporter
MSAFAREPLQLVHVFLFVALSALISAVGTLPLFCIVKAIPTKILDVVNAVAGGLMMGASVALVTEAYAINAWKSAAGITLGALFVFLISQFSNGPTDSAFINRITGITGRKAGAAALLLVVMGVHSLAEGVSIGLAFSGSQSTARIVALSLSIHQLPEAFSTAMLLIRKGAPPINAALSTALTSLPQALTAAVSFSFVNFFTPLLPYGLGFAAGAMAFVTVTELMPNFQEPEETEKESKPAGPRGFLLPNLVLVATLMLVLAIK